MIRTIDKTASAKFNDFEEDETQAVQRNDGGKHLTQLRRLRNMTGKRE